MKNFDEFINEKKKASPAQLAARKKFAEMVSKKKGDKKDNKDDDKPCDCKKSKKSKK